MKTIYKINGKEYTLTNRTHDLPVEKWYYCQNGNLVPVFIALYCEENYDLIVLYGDHCDEIPGEVGDAYQGNGKFKDPDGSDELVSAEEYGEKASQNLADNMAENVNWPELDDEKQLAYLRSEVYDMMDEQYKDWYEEFLPDWLDDPGTGPVYNINGKDYELIMYQDTKDQHLYIDLVGLHSRFGVDGRCIDTKDIYARVKELAADCYIGNCLFVDSPAGKDPDVSGRRMTEREWAIETSNGIVDEDLLRSVVRAFEQILYPKDEDELPEDIVSEIRVFLDHHILKVCRDAANKALNEAAD